MLSRGLWQLLTLNKHLVEVIEDSIFKILSIPICRSIPINTIEIFRDSFDHKDSKDVLLV